ncbi:ribulose-phosphate 3-epimerase [Enterobacterales bacterium endosymbiont of Anomoneura mori]|uniref:ribulose-phosphate 3-epimerase n=1 Tax=Enterobacterales bacterium endosymbiont of Anomoneura mori TaxID=3132096 RepID=UPI00399D3C79
MRKFLISSSILSADFSKLGKDVKKVLKSGVDMIHIDVMDNHYVKNLTFGPIICKSLRNYGIKSIMDVHLMIKPVDRIIPEFAEAGANIISFHPETTNHIDRTIEIIKKYNCKVGIVLNPATPLSCLKYIINKIDVIILMSVNPGYGGQLFIKNIYNKIKDVKKIIDKNGYNIDLEVDGGINKNNILKVAKSGANIFVIGTAIFKEKNYKINIKEIKNELKLFKI